MPIRSIDIAEVMALKKADEGGKIVRSIIEGAPRIELWGREILSIENCRKIVKLEGETVVLRCKNCDVVIHGFDLEILSLSDSRMEIVGKIFSVTLEENQ